LEGHGDPKELLALLLGCVLAFPRHLVGRRLVARDEKRLAAQDWLKAEELRLKAAAPVVEAQDAVALIPGAPAAQAAMPRMSAPCSHVGVPANTRQITS
jgi:hypothetical protein